MITKDGFKYWVQNKDGVPFPEHRVEEKVEGLKTTMTCYLEIEKGSQYSVCTEITAPLSNDWSFRISADSLWISSSIIRVNSRSKSKVVSGVNINSSTSTTLIFSTLETTDDDDLCNRDDKYLLKFGEIECMTEGGQCGALQPRRPRKVPNSQAQVHEASKKATIIGAATQFGEAVAARNGPNTIKFEPNPSLPTHHIIFKYRTRQALILLKVLEDNPVEEKETEDVKPPIKRGKGKGEGSSKRKAGEKEVIDLINVDQDVKPFKKKARVSDAGGSKETAIIDLTK